MRLIISLCIFLTVIFFSSGCRGIGNKNNSVKPDTILGNKKIIVKYPCQFDTVKLPCLLETNTLMITDEMANTPEFNILFHDKMQDSINFMNHAYETDLDLKHYSFKNDTLLFDIYFTTQEGYFYLGKLETDSNQDLIFKQGKYLKVDGYGVRPTFSSIKFKVYIPDTYKYNKLIFSNKFE